MTSMMGEFDGETRPIEVAGWQISSKNISVPELPFELQVPVENEPAFVDLTAAFGSSEPVVLRLIATTTVRFREDIIQVEGPQWQEPLLLVGAVELGTRITVGAEDIAVKLWPACVHGFAPPSICATCSSPSTTGPEEALR
ncbi:MULTISPECIES: hypothetical protein [Arthrobacter]|uniref:Uncharacterized protein n=2 Tax=Arthrobacter TaxID=1663 RepID=A0ABU9KNN8_9MICC|nr:hypothetical protein [Arthrobacter sp. YJM1]MDP5228477.1 hypothetical protein [Arthrobacter sp. YJM1]